MKSCKFIILAFCTILSNSSNGSAEFKTNNDILRDIFFSFLEERGYQPHRFVGIESEHFGKILYMIDVKKINDVGALIGNATAILSSDFRELLCNDKHEESMFKIYDEFFLYKDNPNLNQLIDLGNHEI